MKENCGHLTQKSQKLTSIMCKALCVRWDWRWGRRESGKKISPFAFGMQVRSTTKRSVSVWKRTSFSCFKKFLCPYVAFLNRIYTSTRTRFRLKITKDFFFRFCLPWTRIRWKRNFSNDRSWIHLMTLSFSKKLRWPFLSDKWKRKEEVVFA